MQGRKALNDGMYAAPRNPFFLRIFAYANSAFSPNSLMAWRVNLLDNPRARIVHSIPKSSKYH